MCVCVSDYNISVAPNILLSNRELLDLFAQKNKKKKDRDRAKKIDSILNGEKKKYINI